MSSTFYLAGPTAVGKSELAVAVAERLGAEIVGCDAFQLYKGLPILTAQPGPELQTRVKHHVVGIVPLSDSFDAARFVKCANTAIHEIHGRERHALIVGGSGMYLRALTHGLAELPQADLRLRRELEALSLEDLCSVLQRLDPAYYLQVDKKNPRRLIRALEVCLLTGKGYYELRKEWDQPSTKLRGILLTRDRDVLNERIEERVEAMFRSGVIEEVRSAGYVLGTAAKTIGFETIQRVLMGELNERAAVAEIQQATRQYAKRQMTWFRREDWLTPFALDGSSALSAVADAVVAALTG
jgi:tRNA dimethylallyltransferase